MLELGVDLDTLVNRLLWPLLRLVMLISVGLLVGNLIEALNWTRAMAKVAAPLVRLGRLKDVSGASFSMAFFSGVTANTMLAEAYDQGKLNRKELVLSNLFNSLPTYFLHLPTVFFISVPFLGGAAFVYVGLTLSSAMLRTVFIVLLGRVALPPLPEGCVVCLLDESQSKSFRQALQKTWRRFKQRLPKILYFTLPIYVAIFVLQRAGAFEWLQQALGSRVESLAWLHPEAVSIVVLQIAAEFSAGLAAAGAMLDNGVLQAKEVVTALLVGNVLSSPMRAFRHQFPYYAGIYKPRLALRLMVYNQTLRAASVVAVCAGYVLLG
jgi:hypothetical protein